MHECKLCNHEFNRSRDLKRHYETKKHKENLKRPTVCVACFKEFSTAFNKKRHEEKCLLNNKKNIKNDAGEAKKNITNYADNNITNDTNGNINFILPDNPEAIRAFIIAISEVRAKFQESESSFNKPNTTIIKTNKCSFCNLNSANQKYKPLCATCYHFQNPNSSVVRNYKIKENTIMRFVKDKYPNIILDSVIAGGCSKRRPDGLLEFDGFSIIIEIDENAHKSYEDICENKRLMEIYKDLGFRPLRVIRFNPDSYTNSNGEKIKSIFSIDKESKKLKVKSKKELESRVSILLETIEKAINNFSPDDSKSVNIEYLFFNEDE